MTKIQHKRTEDVQNRCPRCGVRAVNVYQLDANSVEDDRWYCGDCFTGILHGNDVEIAWHPEEVVYGASRYDTVADGRILGAVHKDLNSLESELVHRDELELATRLSENIRMVGAQIGLVGDTDE